MYEFQYFDGCDDTTFDMIETNLDKYTVTLAVTYIGKISVITYDLSEDQDGLYFEYGPSFSKIHLNDFEEVSR